MLRDGTLLPQRRLTRVDIYVVVVLATGKSQFAYRTHSKEHDAYSAPTRSVFLFPSPARDERLIPRSHFECRLD
jgi:hypothetical protein